MYSADRSTNPGYGEDVFLVGIKTLAMRLAAQGASGATTVNYSTLANDTAQWFLTTGFDPITKGLYYGRGFYNCEPPTIYRLSCTYGPDPNAELASRTLSGEAQNAMSVAYEANPTPTNLKFGDEFYGTQWGKPGFGNPPYSDGVYLNTLDSDQTFAYKWIGFLFGIGMSHQRPRDWAAFAPPVPVMASFAIKLAGAASALIKVTEPSNAVAYFPCTASPCQTQIDARQGASWHQVLNLDGERRGLRQTRPDIMEVN